MGFIKAGGGDIFNNFSHDRTLGTHTQRDTTHAVAQKVEFYEKETGGGGGTSALVLVLVLQLGGRLYE